MSNLLQKRYLDYFVDEAGDDALFNRKGQTIVGQEGCSNYFMLGTVMVAQPDELKTQLDALRAKLLADPYFADVPSMQSQFRKTARSFHAKDDMPEVRREVFALLRGWDLQFSCVLIDKRRLAEYVRAVLNPQGIFYKPNHLYDYLMGNLFTDLIEQDMDCRVYFSKRGRKDRSNAISSAIQKFLKHEVVSTAKIGVHSCSPWEHGGLQAVDYYLWAVQRSYEKQENRFLDYINEGIVSIKIMEEMPPVWAF